MVPQQDWTSATRADWTRRANEELAGRALESLTVATPSGLLVEPLYGADVDQRVAAVPENLRPVAGWRVAESVVLDAHTEPLEWGRLAASEGVAVARVRRSDARGGPEALTRLIGGLSSGVARQPVVVLDTAGAPRELMAALRPELVELHGGLDPVRSFLEGRAPWTGLVAASADEARFVTEFAASGHLGRALEVDSTAIFEAGGNATDELAHILAACVERLRLASAHGVAPGAFFDALAARVAVGRDLFEEVAKLRALRLLVARLRTACGADGGARLVVHAVGARREIAPVDRPTNALRTTGHAFAATLGGADTIEISSFDAGTRRGERLSRTTHAVLRHEAALGNVDDPTGGAWYVEHATDALARAAWRVFQRIEGAGGLERWARSGALASCIDARRGELARRVASGEHVVVGANRYPPPGEVQAASAAPLRAGRVVHDWPVLEPVREADFAARAEVPS